MTESQTAAEIAHFEVVERYIKSLFSQSSSLSNDERTLIAGNLRAFYSTICRLDSRGKINTLFSELSGDPLGMTDLWVVKPSSGIPVLSGGRRGTLARGTIGTWKEFELIAALVNELIAAHKMDSGRIAKASR